MIEISVRTNEGSCSISNNFINEEPTMVDLLKTFSNCLKGMDYVTNEFDEFIKILENKD